MTDQDIKNLLREAVAGEWGELDFLAPQGAMAVAGLAIHIRARSPEHAVHIKVYLHAESSGTRDYLERGSPERLDRLHDRFLELAADRLATVPILAVKRLPEALVVIMEAVAVVETLLQEDPNSLRADAPRLLRDLDTERRWLHFDVCPKNVGRTSVGAYCYLDLESLYRVTDGGAHVSDCLTKAVRIPNKLLVAIEAALSGGKGLSAELAGRFHTYQLARLTMDVLAGRPLLGADLPSLAAELPEYADILELHLLEADRQGVGTDVLKLAAAIERRHSGSASEEKTVDG